MTWQHTADLSEDFPQAVVNLCHDLSTPEGQCHPLELLGCWMSESEVRPTAMNPGSFSAGVFQLMPSTAREIGWRHGDQRWQTIDAARMAVTLAKKQGNEQGVQAAQATIQQTQRSLMLEFAQLSAVDQLAWAKVYYGAHRGALTSAAACYVSTFLPALLSHAIEVGPDFVLCGANGPFSWAYAGNAAAFDPEKTGEIRLRNLTARIDRVCAGERWEELKHRVLLAMGTPPSPGPTPSHPPESIGA